VINPSRGPLATFVFAAALSVVAARQLFPSIDADVGSGSLFVLAAWGVGLLVLIDLTVRSGPSAPAPFFIFFLATSTAFAAYENPALSMLGEWIGVICIWAAVRRSASPSAIRQVASVIVVLAIAESQLTWRQVEFEIPELLERYRRGDVGMLRELARAGVEPGFMFLARLEAGLPWGTFGHTNSLAGFLLLAAPFLLAVCAASWTGRANIHGWIARASTAALFAWVMTALALTKGRSAWIGVVASFAVMALASASIRRTLVRRWPWTLAFGLVLSGLFLWKGGNAVESLRYRFEYWQGTLPVVKAHPWFGVGWGSFRDHYLEYKLPQSSEEIADPHNFFMELAACVGIPAALAYLWWLLLTVRELLRPSILATDSSAVRSWPFDWLTPGAVLLVASGLIVLLGFSSSWTEIGAAGMLGGFVAMLVIDRLTPVVPAKTWRTATAAAIVGLHIHLLAAGGVGHPGTMLACWSLAAAAGPSVPMTGWKRWRDGASLVAILGVGTALGSLDLARRTVERDPVLGRVRNVMDAPVPADRAARLYQKAATLTPGDADLWAEIARWRRRRMTEPGSGFAREFQLALEAIDQALELQPLRSQFWHERGMLRLEAASLGATPPESAASAAADVQKAANRYPKSPARQADVAMAAAIAAPATKTASGIRQAIDDWRTVKTPSTLKEVGDRLGKAAATGIAAAARRTVQGAAERALALDAATPHYDKKLQAAERAWLQALTAELRRAGDAE
jgi:O-antigen ligase